MGAWGETGKAGAMGALCQPSPSGEKGNRTWTDNMIP